MSILLLASTSSLFSPVSRLMRSILSVLASHQYNRPSCRGKNHTDRYWGKDTPSEQTHVRDDLTGSIYVTEKRESGGFQSFSTCVSKFKHVHVAYVDVL